MLTTLLKTVKLPVYLHTSLDFPVHFVTFHIQFWFISSAVLVCIGF